MVTFSEYTVPIFTQDFPARLDNNFKTALGRQYQAIVQHIQTLLVWNHISGTDFTKCYQRAAGLALLIVDELQKNLYTAYFLHIINDDKKRLKFESFEDEKYLSIHVAINFIQWMELERTFTTDK